MQFWYVYLLLLLSGPPLPHPFPYSTLFVASFYCLHLDYIRRKAVAAAATSSGCSNNLCCSRRNCIRLCLYLSKCVCVCVGVCALIFALQFCISTSACVSVHCCCSLTICDTNAMSSVCELLYMSFSMCFCFCCFFMGGGQLLFQNLQAQMLANFSFYHRFLKYPKSSLQTICFLLLLNQSCFSCLSHVYTDRTLPVRVRALFLFLSLSLCLSLSLSLCHTSSPSCFVMSPHYPLNLSLDKCNFISLSFILFIRTLFPSLSFFL